MGKLSQFSLAAQMNAPAPLAELTPEWDDEDTGEIVEPEKQKEKHTMQQKSDVVGQKFGTLTVEKEVAKQGNVRMVRVLCACGTRKNVRLNNLRCGNTKSCGRGCTTEDGKAAPNKDRVAPIRSHTVANSATKSNGRVKADVAPAQLRSAAPAQEETRSPSVEEAEVARAKMFEKMPDISQDAKMPPLHNPGLANYQSPFHQDGDEGLQDVPAGGSGWGNPPEVAEERRNTQPLALPNQPTEPVAVIEQQPIAPRSSNGYDLGSISLRVEGVALSVLGIKVEEIEALRDEILRRKQQASIPLFGKGDRENLDASLAMTNEVLEFRRALEGAL